MSSTKFMFQNCNRSGNCLDESFPIQYANFHIHPKLPPPRSPPPTFIIASIIETVPMIWLSPSFSPPIRMAISSARGQKRRPQGGKWPILGGWIKRREEVGREWRWCVLNQEAAVARIMQMTCKFVGRMDVIFPFSSIPFQESLRLPLPWFQHSLDGRGGRRGGGGGFPGF